MAATLEQLQQQAVRARDLELELADLEAQAKLISAQLNTLYQNTLPEMFDELKVDRIGVPPSGNKPGVDYVMRPFYAASIAANWPPARREAAFNLLKQLHAESLIKTEVSAKLPKGNLELAEELYNHIKKLKVPGAAVDLKQTVHSATLGSWLRELYQERHQQLSQAQLECLGASVGRYVKPAERKED